MKAAIGYVHRPELKAGFHFSLLRAALSDVGDPLADSVFDGRVIDRGAAPYLNLARNSLVRTFLDGFDPEVEVLLQLDDDSKFGARQPEQIVSLVDHVERPVVSGLYFAWDAVEQRPRPLLVREGKTVWKYPPNQLVDVDYCGMGFCAISRRWLEDWRQQHGETWFNFIGTGQSDGFQIEDRAFCQRVRDSGHKVHVHTGIKIGHLKLVEVNEQLYVDLIHRAPAQQA